MVTAIPKCENPQLKDYRPISVLCTISKVLERVLFEQLNHVTNDAARLKLHPPDKLALLHLNKLTHKIVHGAPPVYLQQSTVVLSDEQSRSGVTLLIPQHSLDVYRRSFGFRSAITWNKLPKQCRNTDNPCEFDKLCGVSLDFY